MKKVLFGCMLAFAAAFGAGAAEVVHWPVWFSWGADENIDIIGLRMSAGGRCEQVTGFDLGLRGRSRYFNGIQINLLSCEVEDALAGWQLSLGYNSAGEGNSVGLQVGLWNESEAYFSGVQVGLVNLTSYTKGLQVGLINRADDLHGFQVGVVNVIRNSPVQFCPIINIGF